MNRCFFLADTPQKPDEVHQAMFFEYPCTNFAFCFSQQLGYFCLWTAMNSFAIFLSFALMSKQTGCHCCLKTIRLWLYIGNMQPYLLCVCPQQNILNELTLPVPKPYTMFRVPLYYKEFKWEVYDGCPILQQIYAWHCIVLSSHYNTVQKHNNEERSKTMRNLTKQSINLPEWGNRECKVGDLENHFLKIAVHVAV